MSEEEADKKIRLTEVALGISNCVPEYLVSNTVMLCTKNIVLLETMQKLTNKKYEAILKNSASALVIRL